MYTFKFFSEKNSIINCFIVISISFFYCFLSLYIKNILSKSIALVIVFIVVVAVVVVVIVVVVVLIVVVVAVV